MKSITLISILLLSSTSFAETYFKNIKVAPKGTYRVYSVEQLAGGSVAQSTYEKCFEESLPDIPLGNCSVSIDLDIPTDATARVNCGVDGKVQPYALIRRWVGSTLYTEIKGGFDQAARYYRQEYTLLGPCL